MVAHFSQANFNKRTKQSPFFSQTNRRQRMFLMCFSPKQNIRSSHFTLSINNLKQNICVFLLIRTQTLIPT